VCFESYIAPLPDSKLDEVEGPRTAFALSRPWRESVGPRVLERTVLARRTWPEWHAWRPSLFDLRRSWTRIHQGKCAGTRRNSSLVVSARGPMRPDVCVRSSKLSRCWVAQNVLPRSCRMMEAPTAASQKRAALPKRQARRQRQLPVTP